jgi:hypothetical protein
MSGFFKEKTLNDEIKAALTAYKENCVKLGPTVSRVATAPFFYPYANKSEFLLYAGLTLISPLSSIVGGGLGVTACLMLALYEAAISLYLTICGRFKDANALLRESVDLVAVAGTIALMSAVFPFMAVASLATRLGVTIIDSFSSADPVAAPKDSHDIELADVAPALT